MEVEQQPSSNVAIRFLSGPLAEQTISIQKQLMSIGRDSKNDIVILDPRVSREHACIFWKQDAWVIKNLSRNNYVTINQIRTQRGALQHDCVVGLGRDITFVFLLQQPVAHPASPTPQPVAHPCPGGPTIYNQPCTPSNTCPPQRETGHECITQSFSIRYHGCSARQSRPPITDGQ